MIAVLMIATFTLTALGCVFLIDILDRRMRK